MTLSDLLRLLRRNLGILIAVPVVCALICAIVCWGFLPNQYSTTASFYVLAKNTAQNQNQSQSQSQNQSQNENSNNLTNNELTTSQQLANDIAVLLVSQSVVDSAAKAAGLANLDDYHTSIESNTNNRMINLKVTGPDAVTAARVADALAIATSNVAQEIMDLDSVKVVDLAKVPDKPSGPHRVAFTAVAFLVGLLIAFIIIILKDIAGTTVRSTRELEQEFGLAIMGHIPYVKGAKRHGGTRR